MKFPDFEEDTFDFKHNLVLLFSKIPVIDGLTPEDVEAAYNETDESGEKIIIRNSSKNNVNSIQSFSSVTFLRLF